MPNWKYNIRIGDLHGDYENGDKTIQEVAGVLAKRLRKSVKENDIGMGLLDCIENLEGLAEDPEADADAYDDVLGELYYYADRDHLIWLNPTRG
jgi:hypothetical protein